MPTEMDVTSDDYRRRCRTEYEAVVACARNAPGADYNHRCAAELRQLQMCSNRLKKAVDAINSSCQQQFMEYKRCCATYADSPNFGVACGPSQVSFLRCAHKAAPLFMAADDGR